jgi:antitoxin component YwqK of YwqJK toxin-antitoxin module
MEKEVKIYKNDLLFIYCKYYDNGKLKIKSKYKKDKLHGVYREYYDSGKIFCQYNYKNGELHGLYREWYENGIRHIKCNYKNNKIDGECHINHILGDKKIIIYNNGRLVSETKSIC